MKMSPRANLSHFAISHTYDIHVWKISSKNFLETASSTILKIGIKFNYLF